MQGLLLCNKPEGITSFGVVAHLRRLAGERKVGHTGTLDPMATGVLPILFGRATALSQYLTGSDKTYRATIRLGEETDTLDRTGQVIARHPVAVTQAQLTEVLHTFCGTQLQTPPMYSALKRDGMRLYTLARQGEQIDLPPREITIYSLKQTAPLNSNCFEIEVRCSKGTYIRSLSRDIGRALGCGATLDALCRTETAGFFLQDCYDLDKLTSENLPGVVLPAERAVSHLPAVQVSEKQAVRFQNGGALDLARLRFAESAPAGLYRVKRGEAFLGLGHVRPDTQDLKVACLILLREEADWNV